jgi:hypothetical protein
MAESELKHRGGGGDIQQTELAEAGAVTPPSKNEVHPDLARYSIEEQKKIYRRIDWRIMPIIGMLYYISLMDR